MLAEMYNSPGSILTITDKSKVLQSLSGFHYKIYYKIKKSSFPSQWCTILWWFITYSIKVCGSNITKFDKYSSGASAKGCIYQKQHAITKSWAYFLCSLVCGAANVFYLSFSFSQVNLCRSNNKLSVRWAHIPSCITDLSTPLTPRLHSSFLADAVKVSSSTERTLIDTQLKCQ